MTHNSRNIPKWFTLLLQEAEKQRLAQCDRGSSSLASTGEVDWDKPLVWEINIVNNRSPPRMPHRDRVAGANTGYKHSHYSSASATNKNAREERKQWEAEEMRKSIIAEVKS
jgi:hypothetical protein